MTRKKTLDAEAKEQQLQQPEQQKWGAIYRVPLPNDTDRWQQAVTARPEDKPRSLWGAINRLIEWCNHRQLLSGACRRRMAIPTNIDDATIDPITLTRYGISRDGHKADPISVVEPFDPEPEIGQT